MLHQSELVPNCSIVLFEWMVHCRVVAAATFGSCPLACLLNRNYASRAQKRPIFWHFAQKLILHRPPTMKSGTNLKDPTRVQYCRGREVLPKTISLPFPVPSWKRRALLIVCIPYNSRAGKLHWRSSCKRNTPWQNSTFCCPLEEESKAMFRSLLRKSSKDQEINEVQILSQTNCWLFLLLPIQKTLSFKFLF